MKHLVNKNTSSIFSKQNAKQSNFRNYIRDYASKWRTEEDNVYDELKHLPKSNFVQDGSAFNQIMFT